MTLTHLNLCGNMLESQDIIALCPALMMIASLTRIGLSYNQLSGSIPAFDAQAVACGAALDEEDDHVRVLVVVLP